MDLSNGHKKNLYWSGKAGSPEVKWVHFALSGSQSEGRILLRLPAPGASHTVISRKVVKKSACDNAERYCGWF